MSASDAEQEAAQLAAARAGDRAAIASLLARYQERVFSFGLRMCGDRQDAEDVLQDTLLAAARGVRDFRGDSSLSTWLYTIARSHCSKKRRRSRFAPDATLPLNEAEHLAAGTPAPDEEASRAQVKRALVTVLARLAPEAREVIVLRDLEGLTAAEVAKVVGVSVDAVKSRLHRARKEVQQGLAEVMGAPSPAPQQRCPDVITEFSRKLEGELDANLCRELEQHLAGCATCRTTCDTLKRTLAACGDAPAGQLPDATRASVLSALAAALDGQARD